MVALSLRQTAKSCYGYHVEEVTYLIHLTAGVGDPLVLEWVFSRLFPSFNEKTGWRHTRKLPHSAYLVARIIFFLAVCSFCSICCLARCSPTALAGNSVSQVWPKSRAKCNASLLADSKSQFLTDVHTQQEEHLLSSSLILAGGSNGWIIFPFTVNNPRGKGASGGSVKKAETKLLTRQGYVESCRRSLNHSQAVLTP